MVKEMEMEIRKMIVRLDVFEEDELMAYSQGPRNFDGSGCRSLGSKCNGSLVIQVVVWLK